MFSRIYNFATGGKKTNGTPTTSTGSSSSLSGSPTKQDLYENNPLYNSINLSSFPTTQKEKPVSDDELYEQFVSELNRDEDYELVMEHPDLVIKKRVVPNHTQHRVKANGIFDVEFEDLDSQIHLVKEMLWDWKQRVIWDNILYNPTSVIFFEDEKKTEVTKKGETIPIYGSDICRYLVKTPSKWVSEREFVQYRAFRYIDNPQPTYRLYYKSLEVEELNFWLTNFIHSQEENTSLVRAKTLFSGYELVKLTDHTLCINFISQIDFGLSKTFVPTFLLNQAAIKMAEKWFRNFNEALKQRITNKGFEGDRIEGEATSVERRSSLELSVAED